MIGDLTINAQITFNKLNLARQQPTTVGELGTQLTVSGTHRYDGVIDIVTAPVSLPVTAAIGWIGLKNLQGSLIDTPSTPTIVNIGTAGATTYTYKIVANQSDGGRTIAGPAGTTTTGNATLTTGNLNRLTWPAIDNATSYTVYRTVGGATQGVIGTAASATIDDTGLTGDGTTAPATTPYNFDVLVSLDSGSTFPLLLRGGESHCYRVASTVTTVQCKAFAANTTKLAFIICEP